MSTFSFTHDPEADAAYVTLSSAEANSTSEVGEGLIVDWDADGRPRGLEVLYVRSRVGDGDVGSYLAGLVEGLFAPRLQAAE